MFVDGVDLYTSGTLVSRERTTAHGLPLASGRLGGGSNKRLRNGRRKERKNKMRVGLLNVNGMNKDTRRRK